MCVCVCALGVSRYLCVYICLWDIWMYVCASLGVSEFSLCFSVCVYLTGCLGGHLSLCGWVWVSGCCQKGLRVKCLCPRLCSICPNAVRPPRLVYLPFQGTEVRTATSAETKGCGLCVPTVGCISFHTHGGEISDGLADPALSQKVLTSASPRKERK